MMSQLPSKLSNRLEIIGWFEHYPGRFKKVEKNHNFIEMQSYRIQQDDAMKEVLFNWNSSILARL